MFLNNPLPAAFPVRKNHALAAVAVLTLATGISASTAISSAVYAVISRLLLYNRRDQIVGIGEANASSPRMNLAGPLPLTERLA